VRTFTFISKSGDGVPLAQRLVAEGNAVNFYINSLFQRRVGDGLVTKSHVQEELIDEEGTIYAEVLYRILDPKPDCVVFDMVGEGFGEIADVLKKDGYNVVGGCECGNRAELDSFYGTKIMKMVGINTPTTQAPVSEGIKLSTELWFNGKETINVNHRMEEKTLMDGGLGPETRSMGGVVWIGSTEDKLYKEGIGKVTSTLQRISYRGPISLTSIVREKELLGLKFICRFSYSSFFILIEMARGKLGDLLYRVASDSLGKIEFKSKWGIGVVFCIPPYPMNISLDKYRGIPIQGVSAASARHIWFGDVYKKEEEYLCAGCTGNLGTATARGEEIANWSPIRDAKRKVYRTISGLGIPDMMYRKDIGARAPGDYQKLRDWGWV